MADKIVNLSIVHVMGALPSQYTFLALSELNSMLPIASAKREFHFHINIAKMLHDDIELTREYINARAQDLLNGLKHFQHSNAEVNNIQNIHR